MTGNFSFETYAFFLFIFERVELLMEFDYLQ